MSLRKNMVSNLLLTSSSVLFPLITFPYLTRTLASDSMGRVFFIDAFTQYFIIFSAIGIPFYGIREIAKYKNDAIKRSKLAVELITLQLILAVFFSILFFILQFFIHQLTINLPLVAVACIIIISTTFVMEWYYQGIENYTYITKRSLIIKVITVVLILSLVRSSADHVIYYSITALLVVLNAVLNFGNFLKNHYQSFKEKLDLMQHFRPLMVLFSINVSVSVYTVLDTIILGFFTDPLNVSYYNVPLKLVKIFWVVVSGAGVVLIPRIASLFISNDTSAIKAVMTKSFSIVFLLTIPFCGFCLAFPTQIMSLISGDKYLHAIDALRILSVVPMIIGVCNVLGTQYLMPTGEERHILYATIFGLITSLSLNFLLIPHYKFIGTSVACVVSELIVCLYIYISSRKRIEVNLDWMLILQTFSSTVIAIVSGYAIINMTPIYPIILAGVMFVACFGISQIFVFKNPFINSILKLKK